MWKFSYPLVLKFKYTFLSVGLMYSTQIFDKGHAYSKYWNLNFKHKYLSSQSSEYCPVFNHGNTKYISMAKIQKKRRKKMVKNCISNPKIIFLLKIKIKI